MKFFPYLLIYLYPVVGYYIDKLNSDKKWLMGKIKVSDIFKTEYVWILFFLFAAMRGNGNGDYFTYLHGVKFIDSFEKIFSIENYPFEIGFRVIAYLNNLLKIGPQLSIAVMAFISTYNTNKVIENHSKNKWLSWIFYFPFFILFDLHHSRNAIAMIFTVRLFISLVLNNDTKRSVVFSVLAISFHNSSLLAIFLIISYKILTTNFPNAMISRKSYVISLSSVFVVRILMGPKKIVLFLYDHVTKHKFIAKLNSYFLNERWSYKFPLYDPRLIMLLGFYIMGNELVPHKKKDYKHLLNMILISLMIIIFFSESTILAIRFYNYFNIYLILLIPYLFTENIVAPKYKNVFENSIILVYSIYTLALLVQQVPYFC